MATEKTTQPELAMTAAPSPAAEVAVHVTLQRDVIDEVHEFIGYSARHNVTMTFDDALSELVYIATDALKLARSILPFEDVVEEHTAPAPVAATGAKAERSGAAVGDLARRIAEHTRTCPAGFWTGGVPEVRALLATEARGHSISGAFKRIEKGLIPGVIATQCRSTTRAGGTYGLWSVTVTSRKTAGESR